MEDFGKAVGIALVVGVIGPAFWMSVKVLEGKLWLWVGNRRAAKQAAAANNGLLKKLP